MLSKLEITIDFNGHAGQTLSNKQKLNGEYFFKLHHVVPRSGITVDNMHYNLFYSSK